MFVSLVVALMDKHLYPTCGSEQLARSLSLMARPRTRRDIRVSLAWRFAFAHWLETQPRSKPWLSSRNGQPSSLLDAKRLTASQSPVLTSKR